MRPKLYFFIFYLLLFNCSAAQNIGIGTTTPAASAVLDIAAGNKGILLPRMSTPDRNGIFQPAKGLIVYDTTSNSFWFHNGTGWMEVTPGKTWSITGNSSTNPLTNFLGTTDNQPLRFRINNKWFGEFSSQFRNILLGDSAGARMFGGLSGNIAIGSGALRRHQFPTGIVAIGDSALTNADQGGTRNIAIGSRAMYSNIDAEGGTAIGYQALMMNQVGDHNTAIGSFSLSNTIAGHNVAVGASALNSSGNAENSVAIGSAAAQFPSNYLTSVAVGSGAMKYSSSGSGDVAVGYHAMYYGSGGSNTAIGSDALQVVAGISNTAVGSAALISMGIGGSNTAIGASAMYGITSGYNNTAIGAGTDILPNGLNYATAIGSDASVACSNCLVLGGNVAASQTKVGINLTTPLTDFHIVQQSDNGADKTRGIRIQRSTGSNQWRTLIDPSNNYIFEYNNSLYSYINPSTGAFVNPSDVRLKKDIRPLDNLLDKVMLLQAKTYHYINSEDSTTRLYGFVAQDVEKLFPEFIHEGQNGYKGIAYHNFGIIAIKAIQEQQGIINALKNENAEMKKELLLIKTKLGL